MKNIYLLAIILSLVTTLGVAKGGAYDPMGSVFMVGIGAGGYAPSMDNPIVDGYTLGGSQSSESVLPVLALNYQKGFHDIVSVGVYLSPAYSFGTFESHNSNYYYTNGFINGNGFNNYTVDYSEKRRQSIYYHGIKAEGHFSEMIGLIDELDVYAGIAIGGAIVFRRSYGIEITRNYFSGGTYQGSEEDNNVDGELESTYEFNPLNAFAGARYYFTPTTGAYLEIGLSPFHRHSVGYAQVGLSFKL